VSGLLGKVFKYDYVRQLLKRQRRLFDGRNNQQLARVEANGTIINSEETLTAWLNAYEYHRDPEKRAHINSLHRLVPLEHSIPIFVSLLGDKVQAILQLAGLIAVILGRQQTIEVQRRGQPLASHVESRPSS
jgi:hypothetical protein